MPYRTSNPWLFRLSARILVFGLWILLFGFFILYFAVQMMATLASTTAGATGSATGLTFETMLFDSLGALYQGGFVTLGVGGLLMAFGSMFIIAVVK